jgi:hypothetical protein
MEVTVQIPLEGTLPRCVHGIYLPKADRHIGSWGCQVCRPQFPPEAACLGVLEMPRRGTHEEDALRANGRSKDECPACRSMYRFQISRTSNRCADCGTRYPRVKRALEIVREEVVAA